MRAIIVDDEPLMVKKFLRLSSGIEDLEIIGEYTSAEEALKGCAETAPDIAFLDVEMPVMNGMELAKKLREIRKDIMIVFISAYDKYIWDSNKIGGDYYIIKPYKEETLRTVMDKMRLIAHRQRKNIQIITFGKFSVMKDGAPVPLTGKAKEILAAVVTNAGKEISNADIYSLLWEDRPYSNDKMTVYYNALRRLKKALKSAGISDLLISTPHGQMVNTGLFDCDYYEWLNNKKYPLMNVREWFLSEYSWGEYILGEMLD